MKMEEEKLLKTLELITMRINELNTYVTMLKKRLEEVEKCAKKKN